MADAYHLQQTLRHNASDDYLINKQGIEIVYLVDRPVFSIFAEPDSYGLALTAFPSFYEPDLDPDSLPGIGRSDGVNPVDESGRALVAKEFQPSQGVLSVNALLVSEYLFKEKASFNNHILVSPEHAKELHLFALSLARRLEDPLDARADRMSGIYLDLRRWLISQIAQRRDAPDAEWLNNVRRGIVERLGSLDSPMVALARLDRIYETNLLRHAAAALNFDAELINPDPRLIAQWRDRIRRAKQQHQRQPNPHAIEADAITLAQLELLNRNWREQKRLCVLVTNDRGLHRAWGAWFREPSRSSCNLVYALRDPREFLPILDPRNGHKKDQDAIITRVKEALKQLLSSIATSDSTDGKHYWNYDQLSESQGIANTMGERLNDTQITLQPFRHLLQHQIDEVAAAWLQLLEHSIVDRADLVASFAQKEAVDWAQALGGELARQSREQADVVAGKFLSLATSSALLRMEVWAIARRNQPMNINRRRLVTSFRYFKTSIFGDKLLQDVVDELKIGGGASFEKLQQAEPAERLLVIGCMSLGIGAWAAAKTLLEVAVERARLPILRREAEFFYSVARRLSANQAEYRTQFQSIENDLDKLLVGSTDDSDRLRILNELVALHLCRLPFAANPRKSGHSVDPKFALDTWRKATNLDDGRLLREQTSPMMLALQKQYALNTFCLAYYLSAVHPEVPIEVAQISRRLIALRDSPGYEWLNEGVHARLYPNMAEFALAEESAKPNLARKIVEAANQTLKRDADADVLFDIPYVDKLELALVRKAMNEIVAASGPAANNS